MSVPMNFSREERLYSIGMYQKQQLSYKNHVIGHLRQRDWDNAQYWLDAIKEAEAKIQAHQELIDKMPLQ